MSTRLLLSAPWQVWLLCICFREFCQWPCGLLDKAVVFGTKDCRLEFCQGHDAYCNLNHTHIALQLDHIFVDHSMASPYVPHGWHLSNSCFSSITSCNLLASLLVCLSVLCVLLHLLVFCVLVRLPVYVFWCVRLFMCFGAFVCARTLLFMCFGVFVCARTL